MCLEASKNVFASCLLPILTKHKRTFSIYFTFKRFSYVKISLITQVKHNMYSKPTLKHLKPYAQRKQTDEIKTAYNLERVVKLSSNEHPYGYSEKVKQFFASYVPDFNVYQVGMATN